MSHLASGSTFRRDFANLISSSRCFRTFREKSSVTYLPRERILKESEDADETDMLVFFCRRLFFRRTSSLSFQSWKLTWTAEESTLFSSTDRRKEMAGHLNRLVAPEAGPVPQTDHLHQGNLPRHLRTSQVFLVRLLASGPA
jgi:hypothetical protein